MTRRKMMTSGKMAQALGERDQLATRIAGRGVSYKGLIWDWDTAIDRWVARPDESLLGALEKRLQAAGMAGLIIRCHSGRVWVDDSHSIKHYPTIRAALAQE